MKQNLTLLPESTGARHRSGRNIFWNLTKTLRTLKMANPVALIQGASRGLGLQYCKTLLQRNCLVIAACRNPDSSLLLKELETQNKGMLKVIKMDVTKADQIEAAAQLVRSDVSDRLDLLVNAAGMLHPSGRGETKLGDVTQEGLAETLAVNAFGPLLVAKSFAPLLAKGQAKFGSTDAKPPHSSILVNISAKVGSATDNALGGWYSYRMAKSALNMATKNLSIEFGRGKRKVVCVALHPGTVDTDLSRPYHKNVPTGKLFTAEYSVDCHMKIIDNLDFNSTGKFLLWDGTTMPY